MFTVVYITNLFS